MASKTKLQEARSKARANKAQDTRKKADRWAFETSYGDHFETPAVAYQHLLPLLLLLAHVKRKKLAPDVALAKLLVYDPYFCKGKVKGHLKKIGCDAVINANRDFYADIAKDACPEHELLVTNPPFSEDHKERMLAYLLKTRKPFAIMMPSWVANRAYWRQFLWARQKKDGIEGRPATLEDAEGAIIEDDAELKASCFYLVPDEKYNFRHIDHQQSSSSPFFSIWFIGGFLPKTLGRVKHALKGSGMGRVCPTLTSLYEAGALKTKAQKKNKEKQKRRGSREWNQAGTKQGGDEDKAKVAEQQASKRKLAESDTAALTGRAARRAQHKRDFKRRKVRGKKKPGTPQEASSTK